MARRRNTYRLTNDHPFQAITIDFDAMTLSISNPTPYNMYVNIGGRSQPDKQSASDIIAPFSSYVGDPGDAHDFGIYCDNSASPGFPFPLPVVITLSTGAASVQQPLNQAVFTNLATGYDAKVFSVVGSALVAFLTLEDTTGLTAVDSVNSQNWTYGNSQVTLNQAGIGDNKPAVLFGGAANGQITASDVVLTYLKSHWSPDEGSLSLWLYLNGTNAGSVGAFTFCILGESNNNRLSIGKPVANKIEAHMTRGGSANAGSQFTYAGDSWLHVVVTWSRSNNRFRWYANGVQIGADIGLAGTWTVNPFAAAFTQIASEQNINYVPGSLAKFWLATRELSQPEIAQLAILT